MFQSVGPDGGGGVVRLAGHASVVGIDLGREPVPDETTICKFRHLLGTHQLGEQLFVLIRAYLAEQGLTISRGTIVDATVI